MIKLNEISNKKAELSNTLIAIIIVIIIILIGLAIIGTKIKNFFIAVG